MIIADGQSDTIPLKHVEIPFNLLRARPLLQMYDGNETCLFYSSEQSFNSPDDTLLDCACHQSLSQLLQRIEALLCDNVLNTFHLLYWTSLRLVDDLKSQPSRMSLCYECTGRLEQLWAFVLAGMPPFRDEEPEITPKVDPDATQFVLVPSMIPYRSLYIAPTEEFIREYDPTSRSWLEERLAFFRAHWSVNIPLPWSHPAVVQALKGITDEPSFIEEDAQTVSARLLTLHQAERFDEAEHLANLYGRWAYLMYAYVQRERYDLLKAFLNRPDFESICVKRDYSEQLDILWTTSVTGTFLFRLASQVNCVEWKLKLLSIAILLFNENVESTWNSSRSQPHSMLNQAVTSFLEALHPYPSCETWDRVPSLLNQCVRSIIRCPSTSDSISFVTNYDAPWTSPSLPDDLRELLIGSFFVTFLQSMQFRDRISTETSDKLFFGARPRHRASYIVALNREASRQGQSIPVCLISQIEQLVDFLPLLKLSLTDDQRYTIGHLLFSALPTVLTSYRARARGTSVFLLYMGHIARIFHPLTSDVLDILEGNLWILTTCSKEGMAQFRRTLRNRAVQDRFSSLLVASGVSLSESEHLLSFVTWDQTELRLTVQHLTENQRSEEAWNLARNYFFEHPSSALLSLLQSTFSQAHPAGNWDRELAEIVDVIPQRFYFDSEVNSGRLSAVLHLYISVSKCPVVFLQAVLSVLPGDAVGPVLRAAMRQPGLSLDAFAPLIPAMVSAMERSASFGSDLIELRQCAAGDSRFATELFAEATRVIETKPQYRLFAKTWKETNTG